MAGPARLAMTIEPVPGSDYPAPFQAAVAARERRRVGEAFGLTNFGVNLLRIPPGCASSQRHWLCGCVPLRPHPRQRRSTTRSSSRRWLS